MEYLRWCRRKYIHTTPATATRLKDKCIHKKTPLVAVKMSKIRRDIPTPHPSIPFPTLVEQTNKQPRSHPSNPYPTQMSTHPPALLPCLLNQHPQFYLHYIHPSGIDKHQDLARRFPYPSPPFLLTTTPHTTGLTNLHNPRRRRAHQPNVQTRRGSRPRPARVLLGQPGKLLLGRVAEAARDRLDLEGALVDFLRGGVSTGVWLFEGC